MPFTIQHAFNIQTPNIQASRQSQKAISYRPTQQRSKPTGKHLAPQARLVVYYEAPRALFTGLCAVGDFNG
jgi:hypothetical protein